MPNKPPCSGSYAQQEDAWLCAGTVETFDEWYQRVKKSIPVLPVGGTGETTLKPKMPDNIEVR